MIVTSADYRQRKWLPYGIKKFYPETRKDTFMYF